MNADARSVRPLADQFRRLTAEPRCTLVALVWALAVCALVVWQCPRAGRIAAFPVCIAGGVFVSAWGIGWWVLWWWHRGVLALRWQILVPIGVGLGLLAAGVCVAGMGGLLSRAVWVGVIVAGVVLAGAAWIGLRRRVRPVARGAGAWRWLWLLSIPFAAIAVLGALTPPGVLWEEEGFGYDVLEYHLGLPKEYFLQGRIAFAPHNVYASFPANAEMLYLLAMILAGDPFAGILPAKMINAGLAALFVGGAWLAGGVFGAPAGVVSGVAAATASWVCYLCGVAYVENGMLACGALALAVALGARAGERAGLGASGAPAGDAAVAGLLGGFSGGFKYPGLAMITAPLALVWLGMDGGIRRRAALLGLYGCAALVGMAVWFGKNVVHTGNPVFPFAYSWFGARGDWWDADRAQHFAASHAPGPGECGVAARLRLCWVRLWGDPYQRFGPFLWLAGPFAWLMRRQRVDGILAGILAIQFAVWLGFTHLFSRFAVPMLIPLAAGAGLPATRGPRWRAMVVTALVAGAIWNAVPMGRLYAAHVYTDQGRVAVEGRVDFFVRGDGGEGPLWAVVNRLVPGDGRLLLVGEARTLYLRDLPAYAVVFNKQPFAEMLERIRDPAAQVAWLRNEGFTHVLVNFAEIRRLRRSRYGFPEIVTRDALARMVAAGLEVAHEFRGPAGQVTAVLYRVPQAR